MLVTTAIGSPGGFALRAVRYGEGPTIRIPIGIDPIIFQAGRLARRWYGWAIGIAVIFAYYEFRG